MGLPVEVIVIEDPSDEGEALLKKNKKKKKEKLKKRKRKQENEARFYKNPLFDLSNGNVPHVEDQSKDLSEEADFSMNMSVAKNVADVENIEVSRHQKRKKLKLS